MFVTYQAKQWAKRSLLFPLPSFSPVADALESRLYAKLSAGFVRSVFVISGA